MPETIPSPVEALRDILKNAHISRTNSRCEDYHVHPDLIDQGHAALESADTYRKQFQAEAAKPENQRQFTKFSDETKDELFDLSNQIFHDTAFVWQLIDQGDPEQAAGALNTIKARCDHMLSLFEQFRIEQKDAKETKPQ